MAEHELEAVLQFLRENGLSECESALIDEVKEKSQLGCSDCERFFFPMPPPLRIPAAGRADGGGSSEFSSDDEFVSAGSSTTELCSSDFTNPCGICTTRPTSEASSDRLSQFGTARAYPDFENDLFWCNEKVNEYAMPPLFGEMDFDGDPSEDKFIMTVQTGEPFVDQLKYNSISEGSINIAENLKCEKYNCELDNFQLEKTDERCEEHCGDYRCSAHLCDCCCRVVGRSLKDLTVTDVSDHKSGFLGENHNPGETDQFSKKDWIGGVNGIRDFDSFSNGSQPNDSDGDSVRDDEVISGGLNEPKSAPDEDDGATSDELLIYDDKEDDYEVFNLRIIHKKKRTGFEENKELLIVLNSVIARRYYITEFLGSTAFSRVVQAHDLCSGTDVCLKIIKNDKDFFDQSLDEIKLLKFVNKYDPADEHHILRLYDYFYYREHLFIVTELLRANLYEFQKYNMESGGEPYFTLPRLQVITQQCLEALLCLHDLGIVHCDIKPENILIKSYRRCEIKVIDLGSSCFQTDNLSLYVQSRSYRAPEVILGLTYDQKIDLWSIGCILAELYSGEVLFPNEAVAMLLARMISMLGPIEMDMLQKGQETHKYFTKEYDLYQINEDTNQLEYVVPDNSSLEHHVQTSDFLFIDFLKYLLEINPKNRPGAREALEHPWLAYSYEVNSYGE